MSVNYCKNCSFRLKSDSAFCSNCGTPVQKIFEEKHVIAPMPSASQAPRKRMSNGVKSFYAMLVLIVLAIFGFVFLEHLPGRGHPVIEEQPSIAMATMYTGQIIEQYEISAERKNGFVSFPLSILLEKKIIAFDYKAATTTIPLLAFINSDGKLVTAIRMCEPCNSKTFRIEELNLGCGNCETMWKQTNLEGIQGSCQKYPPSPVSSTIDGGMVRILESEIQNWKMRI